MAISETDFELYMYSLNQEFPVGMGHDTFLVRRSKGEFPEGTEVQSIQLEKVTAKFPDGFSEKSRREWGAQWISNQWIENHTKAVGIGKRPEYDPFVTAILREEDFGAVVFDPRTDRVYKLNDSGALLFTAISRVRMH